MKKEIKSEKQKAEMKPEEMKAVSGGVTGGTNYVVKAPVTSLWASGIRHW